MMANPSLDYRYYIEPSSELAGGLALLDFENPNTEPMYKLGLKDG